MDQTVDQRGNIKLGFRLRDPLVQKLAKGRFQNREEARGKAPEVHRYGDSLVQVAPIPMRIIPAQDPVGIPLNSRPLRNRFQQPSADLANATVDRAVRRQRVGKPITDHPDRKLVPVADLP